MQRNKAKAWDDSTVIDVYSVLNNSIILVQFITAGRWKLSSIRHLLIIKCSNCKHWVGEE